MYTILNTSVPEFSCEAITMMSLKHIVIRILKESGLCFSFIQLILLLSVRQNW